MHLQDVVGLHQPERFCNPSHQEVAAFHQLILMLVLQEIDLHGMALFLVKSCAVSNAIYGFEDGEEADGTKVE